MTFLAAQPFGDQERERLQSPEEWTRKVAAYFSDSSEYWNDVYSSRTVKAQVYRNRMALVGQWAKIAGPRATVADVGTGAGHFAVLLAARGAQVVALDASEAMLTHVAQNALRSGVADLIRPVISDARQLEVDSETCDLVVAIGLLSWVEDPKVALAEMARVTKPGGHVIVTMDNELSLARWLDPGWHVSVRRLIYRIKRYIATDPAEVLPVQLPAPMKRRELISLLHSVGLEPLKIGGVGFGPLSLLGRSVLPNSLGLWIDRVLQRLADGNIAWLKNAANFHVVLAVKPTGR